ncbi:zinc finger protein 831 [Kryptolebias marmoratus]|uniref:Zinc finger protein 831 n=1 Tax=Kryptolebias marmoratus TaxID=37003 RepID=A0A3Q3GH44_KRYMA|nr:zinc finger protein 831 [Kryptolebias marmoratus]
METGKPGLASVPVHVSSVTAQAERRMNIQVPLTAVYIHAVPPAAAEEPLQLAVPPLYSKETLPFLTLRLAGGLQPLPGLNLTAPPAKPKSSGKHMCPHCGRDCLKPSVLEKHLRCHTGERPYPCSTCGVSFKTQSNLYKHRRTQAHARLSSESEQSSMGSQDSMSSSRETCTSSLSLDEHREESGSVERNAAPPAAESTTAPNCEQLQGSVSEQNEPSLTHHNPETNRRDGPKEEHKQHTDNTEPLSVSRHLPLQRQEATLFSKQWGSSVSKGKSQSHESTDSGFSESPGSALLDHSMDSLTESSKEHVEESTSTSSERACCEQEPQTTARKQEQELLVERISKLISENTAVVEDKQLENVRPRKTVLSKQGSIDLPMPYTYKNSFHFDMKINPTQNIGLKKYSKSALYSSVPSTVEHAPLTRSHSLPFNLTLMQPERSSCASPHRSDYVTDVRRGSSGQINSTDLSRKPVNQNSSAHRPLVRQTAVDCNHATDGPFTNLSVEEVCTGSLSCDGDGGDICGEPNTRKFRKKKAQRFAFNKWYMYGGGTFKKLYDPQKSASNSTFKGKNCSTNSQQEVVRAPVVQKEAVTTSNSATDFTNSGATAAHPYPGLCVVSSGGFTLQRCPLISTNSSTKAPPRRNLSLSVLPLPATGSLLSHKTEAGQLLNGPKYSDSSPQLCEAHVPSDRKKLRTEEMETHPNTLTHALTSVTCSGPQQDTNLHKNPKHTELQGSLFLPPVAAKNTFLPKYQLKLPNTRGEALESASHVGKSKGTDECLHSSSLLPAPADQTSVTTCETTRESPSTSPLIQTSKGSTGKLSGSLENPFVLPGAVTTVWDAEMSQHNQSLTSSLSVVHSQFATTTASSGGGCTVTQSVPPQLAQHFTPAAVTPSLTTAEYPTSVATIAAVSHHQPHLSPSLLQEQPSAAPDSVNPNSKAHVGPDNPAVPCSIESLDQSAQNVFHVHTADFQICLQIISDEQLALIAPQIEHASGPSRSQMSDTKATIPEGSQSKSHNFSAAEISYKERNYDQPETQKETDGRQSLHMLSTEKITCLMSEEHSETSTLSAESVSPRGPHKSSHVSVVTQTQSSAGSLMSPAASLRSLKSGGTQTLEDEQALSLNCCADSMVIQGEPASQTVSGQHKLSMSSLSAGTGNQKSIGSELQDKPPTPGASCTVGSVQTSDEGPTHRSKRLESEGWVQQVSRDGSDSQLDPQTPIYSSPPLNIHQTSSKPAIKQTNRVGPSGSYPPPLETSPPPLQEHPETCLGHFTSQSSYVQDVPAVRPSSQVHTAGLMEGASAAQKEQKTERKAAAPAAPESSNWRQVTAEVNHRHLEEQSGSAVTGEDKNQGIKADKVPESDCRGVAVPNMTTPQGEQGEETKTQVESFQSFPCFSQTQSEMSEPPAAGPQEINPICPLQRSWENQHMKAFCKSNSVAQLHLSETQSFLSRIEPSLRSFPHPEENQTSISVSNQYEEATASNYRTTVTYSNFLTSESAQYTSFSPDFKTFSSMQFSHTSPEGRTAAGLPVTNRTSKNKQNTSSLSEAFTHLDPTDTSAHQHTGQSSDITNKYQSIFMVSSLYGYQPAEDTISAGRPGPICKDYTEGPSSVVRPVPVCPDYIEDTSSSDDEGKLIIEL